MNVIEGSPPRSPSAQARTTKTVIFQLSPTTRKVVQAYDTFTALHEDKLRIENLGEAAAKLSDDYMSSLQRLEAERDGHAAVLRNDLRTGVIPLELQGPLLQSLVPFFQGREIHELHFSEALRPYVRPLVEATKEHLEAAVLAEQAERVAGLIAWTDNLIGDRLIAAQDVVKNADERVLTFINTYVYPDHSEHSTSTAEEDSNSTSHGTAEARPAGSSQEYVDHSSDEAESTSAPVAKRPRR